MRSDEPRNGRREIYDIRGRMGPIPSSKKEYQNSQINDVQQIFAGAHKGFAPPGSSPDTQPESSINYELGYRVQTSNLYSSIVAYVNDYSNLLGSDLASSGGTGSGDQFNGGESIARGIEASMSYRKSISEKLWVPVQLQYTLMDAYFENTFESALLTKWAKLLVTGHWIETLNQGPSKLLRLSYSEIYSNVKEILMLIIIKKGLYHAL